jgi:hypothetical protein
MQYLCAPQRGWVLPVHVEASKGQAAREVDEAAVSRDAGVRGGQVTRQAIIVCHLRMMRRCNAVLAASCVHMCRIG